VALYPAAIKSEKMRFRKVTKTPITTSGSCFWTGGPDRYLLPVKDEVANAVCGQLTSFP